MLRIAIVEDEALYQQKIRRYLERYAKAQQQIFDIHVYESGSRLLIDYRPEFDIIFLDIEMPGIDGMETAREIRKMDEKTVLAFITNMANYAVQSYEVEASDFIVKPFTYEVFEFKLRRILRRTEHGRSEASIVLSGNDIVRRVGVNELIYVEVERHTLNYHTEKEVISVRGSIKEAEEQLGAYGFYKCSQSYLINLRYVTRIETDTVYVGGIPVRIRRGGKKELVQAVAGFTARG